MLYFHQQLCWHGMKFSPSKMDVANIQHAEDLLLYSVNHVNGLEYSLHLFESITEWAQKHNIEIGHRFRWLVDELADLRTNRILVTGTSGNGKTAFVNSILGENILENAISNVVVLKMMLIQKLKLYQIQQLQQLKISLITII